MSKPYVKVKPPTSRITLTIDDVTASKLYTLTSYAQTDLHLEKLHTALEHADFESPGVGDVHYSVGMSMEHSARDEDLELFFK